MMDEALEGLLVSLESWDVWWLGRTSGSTFGT